jgi:acyl-CoA thioester hydrolase
MDPELAALLEGFPVISTLPVQWGDQDAFGHVNNTVYFRWFESARIAYALRLGLDRAKAAENIGPILASISCHYRRQVTFPDTVHVGARVTRIGRSSLAMEHKLVSEVGRAVAAEATSTLVIFDYNANQSHRVPDSLRQDVANLEGKGF